MLRKLLTADKTDAAAAGGGGGVSTKSSSVKFVFGLGGSTRSGDSFGLSVLYQVISWMIFIIILICY